MKITAFFLDSKIRVSDRLFVRAARKLKISRPVKSGKEITKKIMWIF